MRIAIAGAPRAGKTTLSARLAAELGTKVQHTDDLIALNDWSAASAKAARWMAQPGPWVIEGVAVPRALRKALELTQGKPCDRLIWLADPRIPLTPGQQTMAKGCATVFEEIRGKLQRRGVEIVFGSSSASVARATAVESVESIERVVEDVRSVAVEVRKKAATAPDHSLAERLALDPAAQAAFLEALTPEETRALDWEWERFWARPKQIPPAGDWRFWLILAGRGFGKTRSGGEATNARAESGKAKRIALVGETAADVRKVMIEGESGILAIAPPWFKPVYEPSKRQLTWPNGTIATTYSADEPDQLRGPQHDFAWVDELAKWRYPDAWDQLCMGLRLGDDPRAVITTTPRPTQIIKELLADPLCKVTRGSTYENRANVAPKWLSHILGKYEGTRLGRQELDAEVLEDAPGALWKRDQINAARVHRFPTLVRIVVAVDPSVSSDSASAETGIVVAGLGTDGQGYVLADGSLPQPTPEEWGSAAIALFFMHEADRIVGEVNNGGDLVEANIRAIEKTRPVPFKKVHASRGKAIRAEPVAALYEQNLVHHVGQFALLEDELCQWEPGVSTNSPNRLDALVWAITELMLGKKAGNDHGVVTAPSSRR